MWGLLLGRRAFAVGSCALSGLHTTRHGVLCAPDRTVVLSQAGLSIVVFLLDARSDLIMRCSKRSSLLAPSMPRDERV